MRGGCGDGGALSVCVWRGPPLKCGCAASPNDLLLLAIPPTPKKKKKPPNSIPRGRRGAAGVEGCACGGGRRGSPAPLVSDGPNCHFPQRPPPPAGPRGAAAWRGGRGERGGGGGGEERRGVACGRKREKNKIKRKMRQDFHDFDRLWYGRGEAGMRRGARCRPGPEQHSREVGLGFLRGV